MGVVLIRLILKTRQNYNYDNGWKNRIFNLRVHDLAIRHRLHQGCNTDRLSGWLRNWETPEAFERELEAEKEMKICNYLIFDVTFRFSSRVET